MMLVQTYEIRINIKQIRKRWWENWYHLVLYSRNSSCQSHLASNHICQEQWAVCQYLASRRTHCPFIFTTPEDKFWEPEMYFWMQCSDKWSQILCKLKSIAEKIISYTQTNIRWERLIISRGIVKRLHPSAPDQSIYANQSVRELIPFELLSEPKLDEDN